MNPGTIQRRQPTHVRLPLPRPSPHHRGFNRAPHPARYKVPVHRRLQPGRERFTRRLMQCHQRRPRQ